MRNLLKVDFYRIFKAKTSIIALIVSFAMSLLFLGILALGQGALMGVGATAEEAEITIPTFSGLLLQINYQPFGDLGIVLIVFHLMTRV